MAYQLPIHLIITTMLFIVVIAQDKGIIDAIQSFLNKGKLKVDVGIRNDYLLQDCGGNSMKKSFPDLDYALMGYNIQKGYPLANGHDPGFTHPIFKADYSEDRQTGDCKFSIPKGYTIIPDVSCETSMTSDTIESSYQLKENMGIFAKASGGGWGLSFGASASYKEASELLENEHKVMVISRATCQYYFARIDEISPPPFDDSFLVLINRLNKENSTDEEFLDFINYFGTHFMKTVVFGARYMYEHSMNKTTLQQIDSSSTSVEASLGYSGFGIQAGLSAGYDQGKEDAASSLRQKVETRIITVGSPPPENGDALKWASTVKQTPVPYSYDMESIEKLFNTQYLKPYTHINGEKLKSRLEYIQMRYKTEIYQRSLNRICRQFNSDYQLPEGYCFRGHKTQKYVYNKRQCTEYCLTTENCVAITYESHSNGCYTFTSNNTGIKCEFGKSNELCSSVVFPYKMKVKASSYEEPVPQRLVFKGITINTASEEWTRVSSSEDCIHKCLSKDWCVSASYSRSICHLYNAKQLVTSEVTTNKDGEVIFLKTCY